MAKHRYEDHVGGYFVITRDPHEKPHSHSEEKIIGLIIRSGLRCIAYDYRKDAVFRLRFGYAPLVLLSTLFMI